MAQDLSEKVLETITITRQLRLLLLLLKILDKEFHHNEAQESNKDKSKRNEILHRIAINNRDAIEFQDQEDEVRPKKTKLGITNQHQTCTKIQDEEMTATWKIKMNTMDTIKK